MSNNENEKLSKLKDHGDKMNLAIESTGSQTLAKQILSTNEKDAYLIKVKIRAGNRLGAVLLLVSAYTKKILVVYSFAGNTPSMEKARPIEEWIRFVQAISDIAQEPGVDKPLSDMFGRCIYYALPDSVLDNQMPLFQKNDMNSFNQSIKEKIVEQLDTKDVAIDSDAEKVSSVYIRQNHNLEGKLKPINPPTDSVETSSSSPVSNKTNLKDYLKDAETKFPAIVRVKTMVSPTQGVDVTEIQLNEEVLFKPILSNIAQKKIAIEHKLVDTAGNPLEVSGKFLELIKTTEGEFHLFAEGPNGILLHSIDNQRLKVRLKKVRDSLDFDVGTDGSSNPVPNKKESGFDLITILIWSAIAVFLALVFSLIVG